MIVCSLNGKAAYPSSSDKIKVTYENQFVKDSGSYTYDISFPMDIARNREIAEARMAIEKQEQNLLDDVSYGLYKDFAAELQEIAKKRNVKFDRGIVSTVKELNAKWNSLAGLFEKELGVPILQKDGFKNAMQKRLPGLEQAMSAERR